MHTRTVTTYTTRAHTVTAVQWTGENLDTIVRFMAPASPLRASGGWVGASRHQADWLGVYVPDREHAQRYPTLDKQSTLVFVRVGDWIVRDSDGELSICAMRDFDGRFVAVGNERVADSGPREAASALPPALPPALQEFGSEGTTSIDAQQQAWRRTTHARAIPIMGGGVGMPLGSDDIAGETPIDTPSLKDA